MQIPYAELEAVLVDVGNTLVTMDFEWIVEQLAARGVHTDAVAVARAEAAARPHVSRRIAAGDSTEAVDAFAFYVERMLERLEPDSGAFDVLALGGALVSVLRGASTPRLWSRPLPGVHEALASLRAAGLRIVACSNSDGSVETSLQALGLRELLDAVVDSHVVGYEKPHPRIFELALDCAGARPDRAVHVGDIYAADVVGARSAGLHALLLDPYDDWPDVDCERAPDLGALAARVRSGGSA